MIPLVQMAQPRTYAAQPLPLPQPAAAARTPESQRDPAPAAAGLSASTLSVVDEFLWAQQVGPSCIERAKSATLTPKMATVATVAKKMRGCTAMTIDHANTRLCSLLDAQAGPVIIVDTRNAPVYVFERRDGVWVRYALDDGKQLAQTPQEFLASTRTPTSNFVCVCLVGLLSNNDQSPSRTSQNGGLGQDGTLDDRQRRLGKGDDGGHADAALPLQRTRSLPSVLPPGSQASFDPRDALLIQPPPAASSEEATAPAAPQSSAPSPPQGAPRDSS